MPHGHEGQDAGDVDAHVSSKTRVYRVREGGACGVDVSLTSGDMGRLAADDATADTLGEEIEQSTSGSGCRRGQPAKARPMIEHGIEIDQCRYSF